MAVSFSTMSTETTTAWIGDATAWNVTQLFDNSTAVNHGHSGANAILAEDTIKIIYLVIGQCRPHEETLSLCLSVCLSEHLSVSIL